MTVGRFKDTAENWMRYALSLAALGADRSEVPVGAVVVKADKVIGEGYNRREETLDPTAHAEILAIRQAAERLGRWRLDDCDLYVTLEPCPMCAGALVMAKIRRVFFGASDPRWGACGTLYEIPRDARWNHSCKIRGGILAEDCAKMLREFFQARRRAVAKGGEMAEWSKAGDSKSSRR